MPSYIISSHGNPSWNQSTAVPANMSVLFYQGFGQGMQNAIGFQLQSAIADPTHPNAANVIHNNPPRALWNTGTHKPEINLTGDNHHFYSGIVYADTKTVIMPIGRNQLVTLTMALAQISIHADNTFPNGGGIVVHCLFCL